MKDENDSIDANGATEPDTWAPGADSAAAAYAEEYTLNDIGLALRLQSERP